MALGDAEHAPTANYGDCLPAVGHVNPIEPRAPRCCRPLLRRFRPNHRGREHRPLGATRSWTLQEGRHKPWKQFFGNIASVCRA